MVGDLGEDGAEIGFRIDAVELGGLDQGQDNLGKQAVREDSAEADLFMAISAWDE